MFHCLVFGCGSAYHYRKTKLNYEHLNIIAILDNCQSKWGTYLDEMLIDNPANVHKYQFDYILIMSSYYKEITDQLMQLGVDRSKIIPLSAIINSEVGNGRLTISNQYIRYDDGYRYGIEVGGANNPIKIWDQRVVVKQVDYCDHSLLDDFFSQYSLVKVDIIDDGEKLETFEDNSLDFIVSCHMIEHCRNPIGTIRNFISKLRSKGLIFMAIPDKRYTFDSHRELTTWEHLLLDDERPDRERDKIHYYDKEVPLLSDAELDAMNKSIELDERIHFHVWDANSFIEFIYETKKYLGESFTIEQVGNVNNGEGSNELICVLKKK